ncbi:MAG: hypothetical protein ACP5QR_17705, partial [Rhizomicrobium sp.]
FAKKILPAKSTLQPLHNPNTLSLASRLHRLPPECRLRKQHPKESPRWLALAHPSTASTELYGLNPSQANATEILLTDSIDPIRGSKAADGVDPEIETGE